MVEDLRALLELHAARVVLLGLDVDAVRRTGLLAHVARHAARRAVLPRQQDVATSQALGVLALDLGPLHRDGVLAAEHVAEEVPQR